MRHWISEKILTFIRFGIILKKSGSNRIEFIEVEEFFRELLRKDKYMKDLLTMENFQAFFRKNSFALSGF